MKKNKIWDQILTEESKRFIDEEMFYKLKSNIKTGIKTLDNVISGLQKSNLYVVGGQPGIGKTALAISMMVSQSVNDNIPVAYFSVESSYKDICKRIMSNMVRCDYSQLDFQQITEKEAFNYKEIAERILNAPLFIEAIVEMDIEELERIALEYVEENNVQALYIDFLQTLSYKESHYNSRQEELQYIMRRLKALAMKLDIPIVVLVQNSRIGIQRVGVDGKIPQLTDLWGTSAIECEADTVLLLYRPEYYEIYEDEYQNNLRGQMQIIIAKSRNSELGTVLATFQGEYSLVCELQTSGPRFIPKMSQDDVKWLNDTMDQLNSIPAFRELKDDIELEVEIKKDNGIPF